VNSYTLTFKRKLLISFLMILIGIAIIDISLYFIESIKSTKISFINKKSSKVRHFELNHPTGKDIIFLGSSRTFYHISTEVFKSNNIDIYNFGIPGVDFEDYPTLLPLVIDTRPKKVVISIPVNKLYEKLSISSYPSIEEMKYYYDIDKIFFLQSLYQWSINRHLFLQYLEPIFYKIQSFYSKFDSKNNVMHYGVGAITSNYSNLLGCKVFEIKNNGINRQTLKCTNGDGALTGELLNKRDDISSVNLTDLNQDSISFLLRIIKKLTTSADVTIILEPVLHNKYQYDVNHIREVFKGASILDLTNHDITTKEEMWFDAKHLNYKGRVLYSQYLASILSNESHVKE
jgi:hypothetical protein